MDFTKYENKLEFPDAKLGPDVYRQKRTECYLEDYRLRDIFKKDALEEVGLTNNPKAAKIFLYAWEQSHSEGGYKGVFNTLQDLAELF